MFRFLTTYSNFSALMFCLTLLLPSIFYDVTGDWVLLWVVPGLPFAFLGCQAIIYKSDFSPGPYYGSAIITMLSIMLPFGLYYDWSHASGGFDIGWVFLWIALLFYVPLAMLLGWSLGKFLT